MNILDFYYLDIKYIRNLSKIDDNLMSVSPQRCKQNRPFLGIIILLNGRKYCIPLTSPKDKFINRKSRVDFIKIFGQDSQGSTTPKLIGVLNINNMLPVSAACITKVDLAVHRNDAPEIRRHKELMQKQLSWCRKNAKTIGHRANKVYDLVVNHPEKNINLVKRSSKFKELERLLDLSLQESSAGT